MSGKFLYRAPRPHVCAIPTGEYTIGSIWQCECGKYHRYQEGWVATRWYEISAKRAAKELGKIARLP